MCADGCLCVKCEWGSACKVRKCGMCVGVCLCVSVRNEICYTVITSDQGSETEKVLNIDHRQGFPLESRIKCV